MTLIVYRAIFQESLPYELKGQGRFALINHSQSAVHVYIYGKTVLQHLPWILLIRFT